MYACVTANLALIRYLFAHSANPNIQTSIQGHTALHFLIASPANTVTKQEILQLFKQQGANLYLCNREKQSLQEFARIHAPDLTRLLLNKKPSRAYAWIKKIGLFSACYVFIVFTFSLIIVYGIHS